MKTQISKFIKLTFVLLSLCLIACKHDSKPKFDQEQDLLKFLTKQKVDIKKNTLLIILQKELCSCTIDDKILSYQLLTSPKFRYFNKVLIVPDSSHTILKDLKGNISSSAITIIQNKNDLLRQNGLTFAVNRMFIIHNDEIDKAIDMHYNSHKSLRKEFL